MLKADTPQLSNAPRSDLKLDNLLLVTPGDIAHVKIVDFGVRGAARLQPDVVAFGSAGQRAGYSRALFTLHACVHENQWLGWHATAYKSLFLLFVIPSLRGRSMLAALGG